MKKYLKNVVSLALSLSIISGFSIPVSASDNTEDIPVFSSVEELKNFYEEKNAFGSMTEEQKDSFCQKMFD